MKHDPIPTYTHEEILASVHEALERQEAAARVANGQPISVYAAMQMDCVDPVYQEIDARIRWFGERLDEKLAKPGPVSTPDGLVWPDEVVS